jgi:hypothetical protein
MTRAAILVFPIMEEPISDTGAWRADERGWCLLRPGGCREWSGHFGDPCLEVSSPGIWKLAAIRAGRPL